MGSTVHQDETLDEERAREERMAKIWRPVLSDDSDDMMSDPDSAPDDYDWAGECEYMCDNGEVLDYKWNHGSFFDDNDGYWWSRKWFEKMIQEDENRDKCRK